jgi:hypothetical protein
MPYLKRGGRPPSRHALRRAALLLLCLIPTVASAQEHVSQPLRVPTIAASIASAADWATTYHALSNFQVRELNPLLRPLDRAPGRMITVGAALDAAGFSAWNMTVGRKHPKVAAAGLWGATIFRSYLAIQNLRNTKKAERR